MELKVAGCILAVMLLFAGFCYYQNRKRRIYLQNKIRYSWGTRPDREYSAAEYDAINHYYHLRKKEGFSIDDTTWNDLELDDIFMLLNHTWSCIGESYLYAMLRTPSFSGEELKKREKLIRFFSGNRDIREKMEYFFAQIGKTGAISVFDSIYNMTGYEEQSNLLHFLCIGAAVVTAGIIALDPAKGVLIMLVVLAFCWSTYFKKRKEIEPYIVSCSCLNEMLRQADEIQKLQVPQLQEYFEQIKQAQKQFARFRRNTLFVPYGPTAGGGNGILETFIAYLNMTLHLDLIQFRTLVKELKKNLNAFEEMTDSMGLMECAIAIASFREQKDSWCEPIFQKETCIRTENIYHPMIVQPVKNSITVQRGVLLTGSNASGKSTFLKTMAINAVLAQTISTCLADSYQGFFCRIYSSMALRDNLQSQESYYMVEIKSLKRILDHMQDEVPMICFVDEVLRGTNTVERIAASSQILKSMAGDHVICFAATHDMELTYILEKEYDNYHFQEEVIDQDVYFNYQLYKGRATTRNAIKLLGMIGYDRNIIQAAEQSAEYFMQTGEWKIKE